MRGRSTDSDEGVGIIDAIIAVVVLAVVATASVNLLIATNQVVTNDQATVTANALVGGYLDQERAAALANPTTVPPPNGPFTSIGTAGSFVAGGVKNVTVGSYTYYAFGAGGWCANLSADSWGNGSTTPLAYWFTVGVSWKSTATQLSSSVMSILIPTQATAPASATACPIGLTASSVP